jgi:hypothetical protein
MPLRRIAFVVMLPLAVACAAGEEDPQPAASDADSVVPFHAIDGLPPANAEPSRPLDARSPLILPPNRRAVAGWDFEPASADCNGWTATGARSIRAIPSHSGAYACKLCADGTAREMKLNRRLAGLPRGEWLVSAWARRLVTSPAALAARVTIDEATERAGIDVPLVEEWRLLGEPHQLPYDVVTTSLTIVATAAEGECILVDDVVVERITPDADQSSRLATPYVFMSR